MCKSTRRPDGKEEEELEELEEEEGGVGTSRRKMGGVEEGNGVLATHFACVGIAPKLAFMSPIVAYNLGQLSLFSTSPLK